MTIYGLDIAKYQRGLNLSTAVDQGFSFCMAKCTEGTSEKDYMYDTFQQQAEQTGLLFAAYHFLVSGVSPTAQAQFCVKNLNDKSIPIMLDVESEGNSYPQMRHIKEFIQAAHDAGGRVSLVYIPEWYWRDHMGEPSLTGLRVVQSYYVNGVDFASKLYPGDNSPNWSSYGGVTPTILQYSSSGKYSGYAGTIDVNAFRGTVDDLRKLNLFKEWDTMTKEDLIAGVVAALNTVDGQAAIAKAAGVGVHNQDLGRTDVTIGQAIQETVTWVEKQTPAS